MRVSRAARVLALVIAVAAPSVSTAAPINFDVTPGVASNFAGAFESLNDVAFFQFTLTEGEFNFLATTDSIAAGGGFDPYLTLFLGDQRYTYLDEFGLPTPAESDDSATTPSGVDASLSLLLTTPGIYTLALAHTQNFSHETLTLGFDWDGISDVMGELYPGVGCAPEGPSFGPYCANASFLVAVSVSPVSTTPVPEPGTMSLLVVAVSAIAIRRRRRGTLL